MAYIRFIDEDSNILGEKEVVEIPSNEVTNRVREYIKELNNPKCIIGLYWSDADIKRGYDYPMRIPTEEFVEYLKSIGRY